MYKRNEKLSRHYQANKSPNKKREPKKYSEDYINQIINRKTLVEASEGYFMIEVKK